jgi:Ca-activated chloride channel family protein
LKENLFQSYLIPYSDTSIINSNKEIDSFLIKNPIDTSIERFNGQSVTSIFFTTHNKPNSIVFLLDVSASMRDSLKLPVLKKALLKLVENIRVEDKITLVTYNDSLRVIAREVTSSNKNDLLGKINALKARGSTQGAKAILFALDLAVEQYIEGGNNQVYLITDGEFPFYNSNFETWNKKVKSKQIYLSVVGLGRDKKAMKSLKRISEQGKGAFLELKNANSSNEALVKLLSEQSTK